MGYVGTTYTLNPKPGCRDCYRGFLTPSQPPLLVVGDGVGFLNSWGCPRMWTRKFWGQMEEAQSQNAPVYSSVGA